MIVLSKSVRLLIGRLSLPAPVDRAATEKLALLERDHRSPFLFVDRIDISACFNAHAATRTSGRLAIHLWDIDLRAAVELECRLGTERLEVELSVWVVKADELVQRFGTRVNLDTGWVVVDNEAVVGLGSFGAKCELLIGVEFRVGFNSTCGNVLVVNDLVEVARQGYACAFDGRTARDVEVTLVIRQLNRSKDLRCYFHVPVVGDCDHGLFDLIANQLDFVFNLQAGLLHAVDGLDRWHIPKPQLDSSRVALLAVLAQVLEQNALLSIPVHRRWALKVLLSPSLGAAVQRVGTVVHGQIIALAIEAVQFCAFDAVCDAADVLAEERGVLGAVRFCRGEAKDNVGACDLELLDDTTLRQESERVGELFAGHGC